MELTKEKFCEILNGMEHNYLVANAIDEIIDTLPTYHNVGDTPIIHRDFFSGHCLIGPYETLIIDLLEILMDDKEGYITYYCCALEFGYEHPNPDYDIEFRGEQYCLDTSEDLWDFLQLTK